MWGCWISDVILVLYDHVLYVSRDDEDFCVQKLLERR